MEKVLIREAGERDQDGVWEIFREVIQREDTYVFPAETPREDLEKHWFAEYMQTFVLEVEGKIWGSYILKPNQIGLGDHIANCSYMVHPNAQGRGYGKRMAEHSLRLARASAYRAMQFNIVVSTNVAALTLWQKMDFRIIGTTPGGFRHREKGLVDTHILYREL